MCFVHRIEDCVLVWRGIFFSSFFIETDNLAIIFFGFQIPKCLGGVIVYFLSSCLYYEFVHTGMLATSTSLET